MADEKLTVLIRPNVRHPDWPAPVQPTGSSKEAKEEARKQTKRLQEAICAKIRREGGRCNSANLDWLEMVKGLRKKCESRVIDDNGIEHVTAGWIEGNCPNEMEPEYTGQVDDIKVVVSFRHGEKRNSHLNVKENVYTGESTLQYIYVSFEIIK